MNEQIKKFVLIDLSVVRDRIGNIIFQFPITLVEVDPKSLRTWDGVELNFAWNRKLQNIPDCLLNVESTLDEISMGRAVVDYNKTEYQQVVIGNMDQINHIKISRHIFEFEMKIQTMYSPSNFLCLSASVAKKPTQIASRTSNFPNEYIVYH